MAEAKISIITALRGRQENGLLQAYAALLRQEETRWEWLIQQDGPTTKLPSFILEDPRVHVDANERSLGIAVTRNLALIRSRGELIQNLDSDDVILDGTLARLSEPLVDPAIMFSFGRAVDLLAGGRERRVAMPLPAGRVEPGAIYQEWRTSNVIPVHCAGIMWRREALLAYGGWGAMYGGEDVFVMIAVAACRPSWCVNHETFYYRKHSEQITQERYYRAHAHNHEDFTLQRLAAMHELGITAEEQ